MSKVTTLQKARSRAVAAPHDLDRSAEYEPLPVPEQLTKWRLLRVEVEGVTPLLMHNPSGMRGGGTKQLQRKEIPTPEEEARAGLYVQDGHLIVKADHLRQSMINGAGGTKINKKAANVILAASVMEVPDALEFFLYRNGNQLADTDYIIDTRRCVVQRQGILRSRPLIELPWSFTGRFLVDTAVVGDKAEPVIAAMARAGQIAGLCDYRPQRKGSFGRYQIVSAGFEN